VLRAENRDLMKGPNVWVAWLDAQPEELAERLKDSADRPLLSGDALSSLVRLDGERRPLYAQVASARVETNRRSPVEVCEEIVSLIGSLS
jgi:shikimate kinase